MRTVSRLRWARPIEGETFIHSPFAPKGRERGRGLRYERALAKGLGSKFRHGMWWEFKDDAGMGVCQTDFYGKAKEWIILLETKLSWTRDAEEQLHDLYVPVVACALQVPRSQVLPIVVCKYLTSGAARPCSSTLKSRFKRPWRLVLHSALCGIILEACRCLERS